MLYYVPRHKLKMQPESGLPSNDTPDTQHKPWPMSPFMHPQPRIHVSIEKEGILAQPALPSENNLDDKLDRQGMYLVDAQKLSMDIANKAVTRPASSDDDTLYNCNIIAQLQGNYWFETLTGPIQIRVILPKVSEQEDQYALVHRVSNDGKGLDDLYIYEEPSWFTLYSKNGKVEAVLRKGSNMKHSVKWQNYDDESYTIWRRKSKVKFKIVQAEPKVRRNSISSVRTVSTSPPVTQSVDTPMLVGDGNPWHIRPELLHKSTPFPAHLYSNGHHPSATDIFQSNSNYFGLGVPRLMSYQQQDEMFELIKAYCSSSPILFKRVVDWGTENNAELGLSEEEMKSLSEGRLWVVAHTVNVGDGKVITDSLDDIKGAYQKVGDTMWQQPEPKACDSEAQHRLFKGQHGRWMMEWRGLEREGWQMRAQELEDGQWVDFKNNKMIIRIHVVHMRSILERMAEEHLESKYNLRKSLDFLFTSCNHVKLSKLKGRNLKHHIFNLRVKLEKRYALCFGVQIANTAKSIAQE